MMIFCVYRNAPYKECVKDNLSFDPSTPQYSNWINSIKKEATISSVKL